MKFDDIKKLHQKKYREEYGHFLVEGEHLLQELEKAARINAALEKAQLFVTAEQQNCSTALDKHVLTEKQMAQLSETQSPQGMVALVPMAALDALKHTATVTRRAVYLYEVQDPGNLGTVLRTLAWFGGFRCLLSANSVDPFNSKVIRASMGAIFHVPVEQNVALESLGQQFQQVACMEMAGAPLTSPAFQKSDCLIFGNEARGIPTALRTQLPAASFAIPGGGLIESLNLATAVSLSVYEMQRGD